MNEVKDVLSTIDVNYTHICISKELLGLLICIDLVSDFKSWYL